MKGSASQLTTITWIGFIALAVLYIWPIGEIPVHATEDECRRAIIAMEMDMSGDYLRPTINGELYLNKPPLYNWIVAGSFVIVGDYSAFALRLPVVISILMHGLILFVFVRKYCGVAVASLTAMAFMTNWRTLTLDSMIGLLEHTLALCIYVGFIMIFILGERKKYLALFAVSYLVAAVGFLIKGLPALAHHGLALLVYFIFTRNIRVLFSWKHLAGIFVFGLSVSAFYIPFLRHNHIALTDVFQTLFHESAKRFGYTGVADFLYVLIDFPLDFIRHFLPWTLFLLVLFRKGVWRCIFENRFVAFNALLFAANIPIYWFASLKSPHYLFFFLPLLFTVLFYVWESVSFSDWRRKGIESILGMILLAAGLLSIYAPFATWLDSIPNMEMKSVILSIVLMILFYAFIKKPAWRVFSFIGCMLIIRLAFNWFVVPQRIEDQMVFTRRAEQIQRVVGADSLKILASYPAGFYDAITFPLENQRHEILRMASKVDTNGYYLTDDVYLEQFPHEVFVSFPFDFADRNERFAGHLHLVRFR